VHGQLARFVHPSNGNVGASLDKNRCLRKLCAGKQLKAFASMLIACHFFGMLAGRAPLLFVPTLDCPMMRFRPEPVGSEVCCRRNIEPPCY
jgi:hypothetical protein